jgi:hypothetical protein
MKIFTLNEFSFVSNEMEMFLTFTAFPDVENIYVIIYL